MLHNAFVIGRCFAAGANDDDHISKVWIEIAEDDCGKNKRVRIWIIIIVSDFMIIPENSTIKVSNKISAASC